MPNVLNWSVCDGGNHYHVEYDDGTKDVIDVNVATAPPEVGQPLSGAEVFKSETKLEFEQKLEAAKTVKG